MAGKAMPMQRCVQQYAGVVTRKWPPTGVSAVHAGCKTDDHQCGIWRAEWRHRRRVVIGVLLPDIFEQSYQARAAPAMRIETRHRANLEAGGFRRLFEQAVAHGEPRKFDIIGHAEFFKHAVTIGTYGFGRKTQAVGYRFRALASSDQ